MSINKAFWHNCIVTKRLASESSRQNQKYRSPFDMDHDRIVYSNFFRRMHDKTQVFPYAPLSTLGQARSRLSHSLEVSCVARSLGLLLGDTLLSHGVKTVPYDIGMTVASAALAHDIGNPPFGHSGEDAIQQWAKKNVAQILSDKWERYDICNFEGNAQGFRILTRLESHQRDGGLRPTLTTLASFLKYPCASHITDKKSSDPAQKKFGYFKADHKSFAEIFHFIPLLQTEMESQSAARHPFAYLTEAADDICYAVVDLEDAYHLGILTFDEVFELLAPIAQTSSAFDDVRHYDNSVRIAQLRSTTIGALIEQVMNVVREHLEAIQNNTMQSALISHIASAKEYQQIKDFSQERIYNSSRVLEIECAGFKTLGGLLDLFVPSILTDQPTAQDRINRKIIPVRYFQRHEHGSYNNNEAELIEQLTPYERILSATDYISGMTDRYAVELYQRLSGIKLPSY